MPNESAATILERIKNLNRQTLQWEALTQEERLALANVGVEDGGQWEAFRSTSDFGPTIDQYVNRTPVNPAPPNGAQPPPGALSFEEWKAAMPTGASPAQYQSYLDTFNYQPTQGELDQAGAANQGSQIPPPAGADGIAPGQTAGDPLDSAASSLPSGQTPGPAAGSNQSYDEWYQEQFGRTLPGQNQNGSGVTNRLQELQQKGKDGELSGNERWELISLLTEQRRAEPDTYQQSVASYSNLLGNITAANNAGTGLGGYPGAGLGGYAGATGGVGQAPYIPTSGGGGGGYTPSLGDIAQAAANEAAGNFGLPQAYSSGDNPNNPLLQFQDQYGSIDAAGIGASQAGQAGQAAATGGTGATGTQGGTSFQNTSGNALADELINSTRAENEAARAANEQRYNAILQGRNDLTTYAQQELQGLGETARYDINRLYDQQQANHLQDLTRRGLGNTTVLPSITRGVEEDRSRQLTGLNEDLARERLGTTVPLANETLNFMERRNDVQPNSDYLSILQALGASGYGTSTGNVGLPNATTTPTAGAASYAAVPSAGTSGATAGATAGAATGATGSGYTATQSLPVNGATGGTGAAGSPGGTPSGTVAQPGQPGYVPPQGTALIPQYVDPNAQPAQAPAPPPTYAEQAASIAAGGQAPPSYAGASGYSPDQVQSQLDNIYGTENNPSPVNYDNASQNYKDVLEGRVSPFAAINQNAANYGLNQLGMQQANDPNYLASVAPPSWATSTYSNGQPVQQGYAAMQPVQQMQQAQQMAPQSPTSYPYAINQNPNTRPQVMPATQQYQNIKPFNPAIPYAR